MVVPGASPSSIGFAYTAGEEVVVALVDTVVFDVDAARPVRGVRMPAWAIATIIEAVAADGARSYVLRFRYRYGAYICVVPESAIEGTA